jgi:hypothetical protein
VRGNSEGSRLALFNRAGYHDEEPIVEFERISAERTKRFLPSTPTSTSAPLCPRRCFTPSINEFEATTSAAAEAATTHGNACYSAVNTS